jgi:hypothetical protein
MKRLKLNERQILMLKDLEIKKPSKKIIRINEDQYNRLFSNNNSGKTNLNEGENKEINLTEFAEELIVFIKDVLSLPKPIPFSPYWEELGFTKGKLFNLLKKEGLIQLADEKSGIKEYMTPKAGFRRKVKEVYKKIKEKNEALNELDGGYPAGAENDPTAPYNQSDDEVSNEREPIKADKEIMSLVYYGEDSLCIFKHKDKLFALLGGAFDNEVVEPYEEIPGNPEPEAYTNFVNDKLIKGEMKAYQDPKAFDRGDLALITPETKEEILNTYGNDEELVSLLNQLPESTGAASSGAYVGGASFNGPIRKDTGDSPEEALKDLSEEQEINPWAICTASVGREDKEKYESCVKDVKEQYGIDEDLEESTTTVSVGGDSGTFAYDAPVGGNSSFWTAGNKQNRTKKSK